MGKVEKGGLGGNWSGGRLLGGQLSGLSVQCSVRCGGAGGGGVTSTCLFHFRGRKVKWSLKTIRRRVDCSTTNEHNRLTSGELLSNDGERLASSTASHGLVTTGRYLFIPFLKTKVKWVRRKIGRAKNCIRQTRLKYLLQIAFETN